MATPMTGSNGDELRLEKVGNVALIEIQRPPHNFFDLDLIRGIADIFEALDRDANCRVIVLASEGRSFCAGADFSNRKAPVPLGKQAEINPLYLEAIRLFRCGKPVVAAIHGAAVGGGLGLALVADFRVTCQEARFSANFNRLGFHPGFGLTVTLPRIVGIQKASQMFFSGQRLNGQEAFDIGLADVLVASNEVRAQAMRLAEEIAASAPLAVQSTRATLRQGLCDAIERAVHHESAEQQKHYQTEDFKEGIKAMAERRTPDFRGA